MDLNIAEQLALDLMQTHGLLAQGWAFAFNNNARRAGVCKVKWHRRSGAAVDRRIELSRHWVRLQEEAEVRDTILHEIAHALVGPREGHGAKWKQVASRLGAKPASCFRDERLAKEPLYTVSCPNGCWHGRGLYRLSRTWRWRWCGKCMAPPVFVDCRAGAQFYYVMSCALTSRRMSARAEMVKEMPGASA